MVRPSVAPWLVRIAASRVAGPKTQERVAAEAEAWIRTQMRRVASRRR